MRPSTFTTIFGILATIGLIIAGKVTDAIWIKVIAGVLIVFCIVSGIITLVRHTANEEE